ncbi:YihY/virulence factor BrkB family protein [Autumnicola musiva]|uniref:YihY/virulence factor BrkB family protein n=1 Tax=Autumnicola musiva TaxID=3075589 RepID=A0ABU3D8Y8_9FLAO|nr:YihY/virulence factor BrkB family protein [Zunongwangia sp. F117]MDT0677999.1 YihY/virulence factor BrkB family protein [Zunongwangia sp. F117]
MTEHKGEIKGIKKPTKIKFSGWKKIVLSVKDQIAEDKVSIVSAGVAFYAFLAVFPAIMALISIYGLAVDPQQIQGQLAELSSMMPQQAYEILQAQVESFLATPGEALGWSTAIGILLSLWSANKGTKSLFIGVDIAYGIQTERGFIKENALTLLFTFGAVILVILSMAFIVAFPALVDQIGFPGSVKTLISWARWLLLALIVVFFLALVYRHAPPRKTPAFKWVLPGAILSTVLWLIASWGFSYYVSKFGSYGEVYGSISAIVVLLMWLFLTSFIILLGAELNSETENYIRHNTKGKK